MSWRLPARREHLILDGKTSIKVIFAKGYTIKEAG